MPFLRKLNAAVAPAIAVTGSIISHKALVDTRDQVKPCMPYHTINKRVCHTRSRTHKPDKDLVRKIGPIK